MSSFAKKVRSWYEAGIWTERMVLNAFYEKGRITGAEMEEILGGYVPVTEPAGDAAVADE